MQLLESHNSIQVMHGCCAQFEVRPNSELLQFQVLSGGRKKNTLLHMPLPLDTDVQVEYTCVMNQELHAAVMLK